MPRAAPIRRFPRSCRHLGAGLLRAGAFMATSLLLAACASGGATSDASPTSSPPRMVTIRPQGDAETAPGPVMVGVGGSVTLELPVTTGTGYLWELTLDPIGILEGDLAGTTVRQDGAMPGAVTEQRWLLNAVAPGRTTIRATYRRPWERDVEPARRFSVEVEVKVGV